MKNTLKKAIEEKDIPKAREAIVAMIAESPDKRATLECVTGAISGLPGLFVEDNGSMTGITTADNSPVLRRTMGKELLRNFSREKLSLYAELCIGGAAARRRGCAETGAYGEAEAEEAETAAVESALAKAAGSRIDSPEYAGIAESGNAAAPMPEAGKPKAYVVAWILMALGAAAAVTGLCLSLRMLVGIGIGVLMISTMILYFEIQKRQR